MYSASVVSYNCKAFPKLAHLGLEKVSNTYLRKSLSPVSDP